MATVFLGNVFGNFKTEASLHVGLFFYLGKAILYMSVGERYLLKGFKPPTRCDFGKISKQLWRFDGETHILDHTEVDENH